MLVYTSEPLAEPTELTGPVQVELWASTDAPDTDFTAVLMDVHPDGTALNLCEGAVRARHAGLPTPLAPGAVYPFTIDLVATSIVLPAGHRLRLHVSSSSFPEWEPNPGTGAPARHRHRRRPADRPPVRLPRRPAPQPGHPARHPALTGGRAAGHDHGKIGPSGTGPIFPGRGPCKSSMWLPPRSGRHA